jgi:hypothetical protein
MKYGFRIMALLFLINLLYPSAGSSQEAIMKRILILQKGEVQQQTSTNEMKIFVSFVKEDGTLIPIPNVKASLNDRIYVESGANLELEYKGQSGWLNYDTLAEIGQDGVEMQDGKFYVEEGGELFNTSKLRLLGASEYYVEVKDGKMVLLYVVEGQVLAKDKVTGESRTVLQSKAIN